MTDLSICMVSWNTRDHLEEALQSIYQNTREIAFEVIVVDNASEDESAQMVKERFPQVKLLINDKNRYLSAALNQALCMSSGRHIALLGSDVVILPGALDLISRFMDDHCKVGAVGGKIVNPGGGIQLTCARTFPTLFSELIKGTSLDRLFPHHRLWGQYLLSWWDHNDAREVDLLDAACLVVRRETMEEVGLLDESFPLYSQDLDWCYRIRRSGWRIHYLPQAEIFHYDARSVCQIESSAVKWSTVECRRSMLNFFWKHYGFRQFQVLRFLTVMGLTAKLIYWQLAAPLSSSVRRSLREEGGTYWKIIKMCFSSKQIFSAIPAHEQGKF